MDLNYAVWYGYEFFLELNSRDVIIFLLSPFVLTQVGVKEIYSLLTPYNFNLTDFTIKMCFKTIFFGNQLINRYIIFICKLNFLFILKYIIKIFSSPKKRKTCYTVENTINIITNSLLFL